MTDNDQKQLGKTPWKIADTLRGAINADDFRDYMQQMFPNSQLPGSPLPAAGRGAGGEGLA